jgi:hypothetical protein
MPLGAADLGVFFSGDFTVPVVFAGVTAQGIYDGPIKSGLEVQGFGGMEITQPELRLPFNAFSPMPVQRQAITVNGVAYTVSDPTAESDGLVLCYALKAAS